ncbi:MAG: hypothetical protein R3B84_17010 [Zavarzinella sp.]
MLVAIACLAAGTYGALHNQISYTICPEYFTQYKFEQFLIQTDVPDRIGAALVGWKAAWWMGLFISSVLISVGLLFRQKSTFFRETLLSYFIVAATTLICGIAALIYAFITVDEQSAGQVFRYGNEIIDDVGFVRAGTMHNVSYFGGLAGIITVWLRNSLTANAAVHNRISIAM